MTRASTGYWVGPPLCSVVVKALWGQDLHPAIGVEAPRSGSKLWCEVGGTKALPLGKKWLFIPPQELSVGTSDSVMPLATPVCVPTKAAVAGTTLGPNFTVGRLVIVLDLPPVSMSSQSRPKSPPLWECRQSA